jgi:hypothetical protein
LVVAAAGSALLFLTLWIFPSAGYPAGLFQAGKDGIHSAGREVSFLAHLEAIAFPAPEQYFKDPLKLERDPHTRSLYSS